MAVLVEAISVIIPLTVLDVKDPGGRAHYERDCPNKTFCADEYLSRVGFMVPDDVRAFVHGLSEIGLVHTDRGQAIDLVVVDQDPLKVPIEQLHRTAVELTLFDGHVVYRRASAAAPAD